MSNYPKWQQRIIDKEASMPDTELIDALIDAVGERDSEYGSTHDAWEVNYLKQSIWLRLNHAKPITPHLPSFERTQMNTFSLPCEQCGKSVVLTRLEAQSASICTMLWKELCGGRGLCKDCFKTKEAEND